jgi:hypothetical protein
MRTVQMFSNSTVWLVQRGDRALIMGKPYSHTEPRPFTQAIGAGRRRADEPAPRISATHHVEHDSVAAFRLF